MRGGRKAHASLQARNANCVHARIHVAPFNGEYSATAKRGRRLNDQSFRPSVFPRLHDSPLLGAESPWVFVAQKAKGSSLCRLGYTGHVPNALMAGAPCSGTWSGRGRSSHKGARRAPTPINALACSEGPYGPLLQNRGNVSRKRSGFKLSFFGVIPDERSFVNVIQFFLNLLPTQARRHCWLDHFARCGMGLYAAVLYRVH